MGRLRPIRWSGRFQRLRVLRNKGGNPAEETVEVKLATWSEGHSLLVGGGWPWYQPAESSMWMVMREVSQRLSTLDRPAC